MACAICRLPLEDHQSALHVLGELPFDTIESVLKHQWQKDITRIIYAHAEHYHDQMLFEYPPSHREQIDYIEDDIRRHRAKYIMHYLHAVVEVYRHEEVGPTRVTMEDEILIRKNLEEALDYKLPTDLDAIFRKEKPYAWRGTMTWEQSSRYREAAQNDVNMASRMFGHGYIQDAIDRRLITVISIVVRLYGGNTGDEFVMFIPKVPDPMWCWNQTTEHIEEFQRMTKLDLL